VGHSPQHQGPMMFIFTAGATIAAIFLAHLWPRDRAVYVNKKTLAQIDAMAKAEEERAARDRMVYELARDLVDRLATDTTCRHQGEPWLGDRCWECAVVMAKETIHKALTGG
jgi:hypothetical protein